MAFIFGLTIGYLEMRHYSLSTEIKLEELRSSLLLATHRPSFMIRPHCLHIVSTIGGNNCLVPTPPTGATFCFQVRLLARHIASTIDRPVTAASERLAAATLR